MPDKPLDHACVPAPQRTAEDLPTSINDYYRESRLQTGEVVEIQHGDCTVITTARLERTGAGSYTIAGPPSHNEHGGQPVATILACRLSQSGVVWTADLEEAKGPERGIDWWIRSNQGHALGLQVTRVVPQKHLAAVGRTGRAEEPLASIDSAVEDLWAAIERKRTHADPKILLALDARHPGFHTLPAVIDAFRSRFSDELQREIRYREVWVVGLTVELTSRLSPTPQSPV